jgi:hypothetical protein
MESLATQKKKKRHIYEGIVKYHDLFGVFLTFDKELSRPSRFALYYLRINLMITLSAVFCQSLDQIESIILSVIVAMFLIIPASIITAMIKSSYKCL